MQVELAKDDLVKLVMGSTPIDSMMSEYSRLEYGHWTGGHVDEWTWYKWVLNRLDEEELYKIFQECKTLNV